MAIENLGSKLYSGTKTDRVSDSLGSSADGTNSGITQSISLNSSTNKVDFDAKRDGNNYAMSYDLGATISDTQWVARFPVTISTLTGNSGQNTLFMFFGLSSLDAKTGATSGSFDYIGTQLKKSSGASLWKAQAVDGGALNVEGTDFAHTLTTQTYYVEIKRTGATSATVELFSDSGYSSSIESESLTPASTIQNLRYIWIGNQDSSGGTTNKIVGTVGEIKVWNSTTTASGTATYTASPNSTTNWTSGSAKLGTGAYSFDGSNDYVTVGSTSDWNFVHDGSGATVSAWVYRNGSQTGNGGIFVTEGGQSTTTGFGLGIRSGGNAYARTINTSNQWQVCEDTNSNISTGEWHHILATIDSSSIKLYVDGTLNSSHTISGTLKSGNSSYNAVGRAYSGSAWSYLNGNLDDMGVWKRVLTATEISDLVNAQNASIGSDGNFTSNSNLTYGETGIVGNAIKGNGSSSYAENGTNTTNFKYIHGVDETWTINFWFKKTTAETNNTACIMGTCGGGAVVGFRINYLDRTDESETRQLQLNIRSGNGAMYTINNDSFFPNDTNWHMMTITGDNSVTSNSVYVYLDNTQKVTANRSVAGSDTSTQHELNLFREPDGSPYWDGTLDEMSFWNRVLTSDERTALYNSGSGAVTTTAVTNHKGLKAYYDMNESSGTIENKVTYSATGALVSSLTNKSELKAYYSMDSTSMGAVANYTTNFSSNTGWTESSGNVTIDTSDEEMDFHIESGTSGAKGYYDLTTVSDTNWVLRFENWNLSTLNTYGGMWMGISSQTSADGANSGSSIFTRLADYGDGDDYLVVASFNSSTTRVDGSVGRPALSTGTNYNIELSRDGTTVTTKLFTDNFKTPIATSTDTISGTTGLRYLFVGSEYQPASGNTNTNMIGTMQGIKFYNGVSAVDGCKNDFSSTSDLDALTGVRTNSIFQQTDDTPSYWWKQSDGTWKLDGSNGYTSDFANSQTGWTAEAFGGGSTSNGGADTTGVWGKCNSATASNQPIVYYDLGSALSSKWIMRFRCKHSSTSKPNNYNYFGISAGDAGQTSSGQVDTTATNNVTFYWSGTNNKADGTSSLGDPSTAFSITGNVWYYWELIKDGTSGTLKTYGTDSTYTSGSVQNTFTATSTNDLRWLFLKASTNANNDTKFYVDAIQLQNGFTEWQG